MPQYQHQNMKGVQMQLANIALFAAFIGTLTLINAQQSTVYESIDAQITAIKAAPVQQRVQLMNQLKQQLATMNQNDRMMAISQLRASIHSDGQNSMQKHQNVTTNTKVMIQNRQMQQNEQMNHMQNQHQKMTADKFMNTQHTPSGNGMGGSGSHPGMR
jgi:hypothetical protein